MLKKDQNPSNQEDQNPRKKVRFNEVVVNDELNQKMMQAFRKSDFATIDQNIFDITQKEAIKDFFTQDEFGTNMMNFFAMITYNFTKKQSYDKEFFKKIVHEFMDMDTTKTSSAFFIVRINHKGLYPREILGDYEEVVNHIVEQSKNEDYYTEEKGEIEPGNPTKKAKIEGDDDHSLTIEQKIEELKVEEQGRSNLESASSANQRATLGLMTSNLENQKKKIHQEEVLVKINKRDNNLHSVDTHSYSDKENASSLYDLVNDFAWLEDLPKFIQKMLFPHLLESLNESAKYIKEVFDLKSSKQALFNGNQNDISSTSNNYDLEDNISEAVSLLNTPSNNYIDMNMILADATVNYDILPVDIGSKFLPDY